MRVEEIREKVEHKILDKYHFGSVVYGTNSKSSDKDYIVIVEADNETLYSIKGEIDYTVYSEDMFIESIKRHEISVLECIFQNQDDNYAKYFELDLEKLRRSISSVSSNSYVKCKKKIQEGDINTGLKSLFHSLRILDYGIQIATYERIIDYSRMNNHFYDIMEIGGDWNTLHKKYKPIFNKLKTKFRKLCPLQYKKKENEL